MNNTIAQKIWELERKKTPDIIKRFQNGLCNYVFYIQEGQDKFTLRITEPQNIGVLKGTLYWLELFKDLNLPMPKLIRSNLEHNPPYAIFNYIDGTDLGVIYSQLSESEKKAIARSIIDCQKTLGSFKMGKGFGHLSSYEDANKKQTWKEVVVGHLERSKSRINDNKIFDDNYISRIEKLLGGFDSYFNEIQPVPFFDDATTKNVLIHNGKFSGIIDLDWVCFGDRLYTIALTRMSLLASKSSLSYIDYLIAEENLSEQQLHVLDFYTLVFCVDFMSETGMKFNKDIAPNVTKEEVEHLQEIFEKLIINFPAS